MLSPTCFLTLLAASSLITISRAGPIGPLANITSSDLGLKEGSCAVGDVVYLPGDEFPGSGPCERCACAAGAVRCDRQKCEPRPGCKALHRPDHCCPTYQCECEQDGRVYGNGEKLVDPADPCRVCYCQGGEVVCRRIACFLRDDCQPRLVPGRCCPEYDNCPLRGVTTVPGAAPSISSIAYDNMSPSIPPTPKENIKQEITIKEITPVSEIPITDVKIKEILPSPSIEVIEYSSSKSPLIPREITSEKILPASESTEQPGIIEVLSSSSPDFVSASASSPVEMIASSSEISEVKITNDSPSKLSFPTQDSINNEPVLGTASSPSMIREVISTTTNTKTPVLIEEDDSALFDHNPAFPPIPDDLTVRRNHEDEMATDQSSDSENVSTSQEVLCSSSTIAEPPATAAALVTTVKEFSETQPPTIKIPETSTGSVANIEGLKLLSTKESPMLNLRSAIPTEILNVPSLVTEDITGELVEATELSTMLTESSSDVTSTENIKNVETKSFEDSTSPKIMSTSPTIPGFKKLEFSSQYSETSNKNMPNEITTNPPRNTDIVTEVTSQLQTELSSLPIETSDQNPHEVSVKEKTATSSALPTIVEEAPTKFSPVEQDVITITKTPESHPFENVETTEFVLTSFGSAESATDAVELIKISPEPGKSAAIIESNDGKKNNALTDFINLVGDVASISDHSESQAVTKRFTNSPISDSEELIPVNAGYKSKNSNWNVNSITEVVPKSKYPNPVNKQKVIEIEDDEDGITDSPPPNDKIEPTTRRPIIDNVSDNMPENKTEKKDIEIINQTYVPTVNRRPTKVVMKKNNEKPISDEISISSSESATFLPESTSAEYTGTEVPADLDTTTSETNDRRDILSNTTINSSSQ